MASISSLPSPAEDSIGKRVWMDLNLGNDLLGRIVIELFWESCPKTCENFRVLCTGERGAELHYRGNIFHRVIPDFMAQGGDIVSQNGFGSRSIYGEKFADEDFTHKFTSAGLLACANSGANTNGSQFFITFGATPHLNNKHVVFGRVLGAGMNIVRRIEEVSRTHRGPNDLLEPGYEVTIAECGDGPSDLQPPVPEDGDVVPDFPNDNVDARTEESKHKIAKDMKDIGNKQFKEGHFQVAADKYRKALRYLEALVTQDTATMLACYTNAAQCYLKLGSYKEAVNVCTSACELDPNNVKAWYRRGLALVHLNEFDEAITALEKAKELDPANADVQNNIDFAHERRAELKAKERAKFSKMFA